MHTEQTGEQFRSLAEIMPETVYEADRDGNLVFMNQHGLTLFGFSPEDVREGISIFRMIIAEQRELAIDCQQSVMTHRVQKKSEYTAVRKDGSHFPVLIYNSPRETSGEVTGIRGIVVDLTELGRTLGAVRRANRKLNLLASVTRHDIQNKIAVMMGNLAIARSMNGDPALDAQIQKLETITRDISDQILFTRIYRDFGTDEPVWQELGRIIAQLDIPRSITLHNNVNGIEVFADLMLGKVFYNLFTNTAMHGARVTTISVLAREEADRLVIVWEDDGMGIPASDKEAIFGKGVGKNSGYGLFLSREILSITEMTITETGEPGKCGRFEIAVPVGLYRFAEK
jgi:PAS domain S-box-containing protein